MHADAKALLRAHSNERAVGADAHEAYVSRMVARAMLNDDVIVARLTELLKSLRKLPSYAQQLARQVLPAGRCTNIDTNGVHHATCRCKLCLPGSRPHVLGRCCAPRICSHKQVTTTTDTLAREVRAGCLCHTARISASAIN